MFTKSKSKELKAKSRIEKFCVYAFLLVFSLSSLSANAQCAMCRAALTSEGNTTKAAAVNDGIVYLMVIPYLLVAGIGYAIYRMKKKKS
ncbi:hypothetical protein [Flavobacterium sp. XS1P27]|uniref:hypothetical protein n=1 Tax=Flavobacterium sp. XS1P27 TaxID=3401724 RepID=UPI003AAC0E1E